MSPRKNPSLIIGIAIPVLMIVFVGASIYLPGLFVSPETDFAYLTGQQDRWGCRDGYAVKDGVVKKIELPVPPVEKDMYVDCLPPEFYIYEAKTGVNREVTFEELEKMKLDSSRYSPDGFEVVRGGGGGGFPFFDGGRNYNTVYLRGKNVSRKIDLKGTGGGAPYDYYNFQFLGWILPS